MTAGQQEVLDVLGTYGPLPDHALVPLAQHVTKSHQSSSSIRSRRAELVRMGRIRDAGNDIVMPSGRRATSWEVV